MQVFLPPRGKTFVQRWLRDRAFSPSYLTVHLQALPVSEKLSNRADWLWGWLRLHRQELLIWVVHRHPLVAENVHSTSSRILIEQTYSLYYACVQCIHSKHHTVYTNQAKQVSFVLHMSPVSCSVDILCLSTESLFRLSLMVDACTHARSSRRKALWRFLVVACLLRQQGETRCVSV